MALVVQLAERLVANEEVTGAAPVKRSNFMSKKLLFRMTAKDFKWDTFRSGGKGGQNQNKVESGVRCTHEPSGAVGTARDSRDQHRNRKAAFLRCVNSEKFRKWHKMETARRLGQPKDVETRVTEMMLDENLKVEYYTP